MIRDKHLYLHYIYFFITTTGKKNETKPTKNQKGLPFTEHVNFGFFGSSKSVDKFFFLDK